MGCGSAKVLQNGSGSSTQHVIGHRKGSKVSSKGCRAQLSSYSSPCHTRTSVPESSFVGSLAYLRNRLKEDQERIGKPPCRENPYHEVRLQHNKIRPSSSSYECSSARQYPDENFRVRTSVNANSRIRVTLSSDGSMLEVETEKLSLSALSHYDGEHGEGVNYEDDYSEAHCSGDYVYLRQEPGVSGIRDTSYAHSNSNQSDSRSDTSSVSSLSSDNYNDESFYTPSVPGDQSHQHTLSTNGKKRAKNAIGKIKSQQNGSRVSINQSGKEGYNEEREGETSRQAYGGAVSVHEWKGKTDNRPDAGEQTIKDMREESVIALVHCHEHYDPSCASNPQLRAEPQSSYKFIDDCSGLKSAIKLYRQPHENGCGEPTETTEELRSASFHSCCQYAGDKHGNIDRPYCTDKAPGLSHLKKLDLTANDQEDQVSSCGNAVADTQLTSSPSSHCNRNNDRELSKNLTSESNKRHQNNQTDVPVSMNNNLGNEPQSHPDGYVTKKTSHKLKEENSKNNYICLRGKAIDVSKIKAGSRQKKSSLGAAEEDKVPECRHNCGQSSLIQSPWMQSNRSYHERRVTQMDHQEERCSTTPLQAIINKSIGADSKSCNCNQKPLVDHHNVNLGSGGFSEDKCKCTNKKHGSKCNCPEPEPNIESIQADKNAVCEEWRPMRNVSSKNFKDNGNNPEENTRGSSVKKKRSKFWSRKVNSETDKDKNSNFSNSIGKNFPKYKSRKGFNAVACLSFDRATEIPDFADHAEAPIVKPRKARPAFTHSVSHDKLTKSNHTETCKAHTHMKHNKSMNCLGVDHSNSSDSSNSRDISTTPVYHLNRTDSSEQSFTSAYSSDHSSRSSSCRSSRHKRKVIGENTKKQIIELGLMVSNPFEHVVDYAVIDTPDSPPKDQLGVVGEEGEHECGDEGYMDCKDVLEEEHPDSGRTTPVEEVFMAGDPLEAGFYWPASNATVHTDFCNEFTDFYDDEDIT